jgi:hypothetical protein
MVDRIGVRARLGLVLVGAAALGAAGSAWAAGTKVPNGDELKGLVEKLYNGSVPTEDTAGREKVFLAIDKILQKDSKKNVAIKTPDFWVEAIQEGRFTGGPRKAGKLKGPFSEDIDITLRDAKPDDKPKKAKFWYRAGALVNPTKPAPLLVSILEKDADPKAYIEGTWAADDDFQKNWVLVAMAESDDFPVTKDPYLILQPFRQALDRFNTDANRWYIEGVGKTCPGVQAAASQFLSNRLAGMILRGPAAAVTSVNTALYPTVVVHGKTDAAGTGGAAVFAAYQKIDPTANTEVLLDDVNTMSAKNDQLIAWIASHAKRVMPSSYSFVTTISETGEGENWTGSINIVSPAKRGQPTKVTVKYIRDDPVNKLPNTVDIQCENLDKFWLYMNDDLLDLDKEVAVFVNGTQIAKKVFDRDMRQMFWIADNECEWGRVFPAIFRCVVPSKIVAPTAPPAGPDPNGPKPPDNGPPANPPTNPPAPANPK